MARQMRKQVFERVPFSLRLPRELHKDLKQRAEDADLTLNEFMCKVLAFGSKAAGPLEKAFDDVFGLDFTERLANEVLSEIHKRGRVVRTTATHVIYEDGTKVRVGRSRAVKQKGPVKR